MLNFKKVKIGVLALQGAFKLHQPHIESFGGEYVEVINKRCIEKVDGLILPGGESGVMLKLIEITGLEEPLQEFIKNKPVWGICAGAILLAKTVKNPKQKSYSCIDIEIERNSYGRQLQSSNEIINGYTVSFIRAPKIVAVGKQVKILSEREGFPTCVEDKNVIASTFHPETNGTLPSPWHQYFIRKVKENLEILE